MSSETSTLISAKCENDLTHLKETIQDGLNDVTSKVKSIGAKIGDNLERGKLKTAETLETTSRKLESTSRKVNDAANYVYEKNSKDMVMDVWGVIRNHPFKTLMVLGFIGMFLCQGKKQ